MNYFGSRAIPFIFILDFDLKNPIILPVEDAKPPDIHFNINGFSNVKSQADLPELKPLQKFPIPFQEYKKAFEQVVNYQRRGYSFLVNLTFQTKIFTCLSLSDIFHASQAKYKLLYKDQFVLFSPESFIKIYDGNIYSFPMKGTIDASVPNAEQVILNDHKEQAEHATIVDLIRNDLSMIASRVTVDKYRYIDKIKSTDKELLQVSSIISGQLEKDYAANIGSIMYQLLPAGSVSGAPKPKTIEIIKEVENYDRGYYTGVFGYFDGRNLDSCVMIRFIEKQNGEYFYKSGGGITVYSNPESEYEELINKIYVPVH